MKKEILKRRGRLRIKYENNSELDLNEPEEQLDTNGSVIFEYFDVDEMIEIVERVKHRKAGKKTNIAGKSITSQSIRK